MGRNKFMFFENFKTIANKLDDKMRLKFYDALTDYVFEGKEPDDVIVSALLEAIKPSLDKEDGRKNNGGNHNPKGINQHTEKNDSGQNRSNQVNLGQFLSRTETETETETKKERYIERKKVINPTLEEVLEYAKQMDSVAGCGGFKCSEKTAREFYDFYAGQGWVTSGNIPIRNWQVKLRGWALKPNNFKSKQEEEELKPLVCEC